jgi:hypothetical protein
MDRFSISLNKKPPPPIKEILIEDPSLLKHLEIDPDIPAGIPHRVITHELENSEMNHTMYMEAIRVAAMLSCEAGMTGLRKRLYSVRLISNAVTGKFEIRLVFI